MGLIQINPYACSLVAGGPGEDTQWQTPNCMCPYITIERLLWQATTLLRQFRDSASITGVHLEQFLISFLSTGHVTQLELCASKLKE